jgi:cytochrome c peroxidase
MGPMRLFAAAVFLLPVISRASEVSDDRVRYALRVIDAGRLAITPRPPRPKPGEVELGRRLFFDPRLSRSGVMSCSSCHNPARAWTDGLPRAMGNAGEAVKRRTPSLLNLYLYADKFFWDGRAASVEQAALTALRNPLEMNGDSAFVLARLASIPGYARRFGLFSRNDPSRGTLGVRARADRALGLEPSPAARPRAVHRQGRLLFVPFGPGAHG